VAKGWCKLTFGLLKDKGLNDLSNEDEKRLAAHASLKLVEHGNVVGLGSGSTADYFIRQLGELVRSGLKVVGIPASFRSRDIAAECGIPLTTLDAHPEIDITIDGADEINPDLALIKGGGGALLMEKIIASASKKFVVIADHSKQVATLGHAPLPIEVIPQAQAVLAKKFTAMGALVQVRQYTFGNPFITEEGHQILDCLFGEIIDPQKLGHELDSLPGVVEHGLFIGMASVVLVAKGSEVQELRR
jgi:ribose 5-phosphate isomerase A